MIEKIKYLATCDNCGYIISSNVKKDIYRQVITYRYKSISPVSDALFIKKYGTGLPSEYHFCSESCEKEYKSFDTEDSINDPHYIKVNF